jgi:hypothetical protein
MGSDLHVLMVFGSIGGNLIEDRTVVSFSDFLCSSSSASSYAD